MKIFRLESAELDGKSYASCYLVLDEQTRTAQVRRITGLVLKKESTLVALRPDQFKSTKVSGKNLTVGKVTLSATDDANTAEIGKALMAMAPPPAVDTAGPLLKSVSDFLLRRGATIDFLSNYATSPRVALFSLGKDWNGEGAGPLQAYLEKSRSELSANLEKITSAANEDAKYHGTLNVDRVCAFAYAAGKIQDSLVDGAGKGEIRLLKELGVVQPAIWEGGATKSTEMLLETVSRVLLTDKLSVPSSTA